MLIARFLDWSEGAGAEARAEAAGALAGAYLYGDLDSADTGDALRVLTLLLDDPSPLVRRMLAETFATAVDAPHHILSALAGDRSDIAAIVLERSFALSDAELIDAVAIGDEVAQCAVARRPNLSAALAGAIAEVAGFAAVLAVSRNAGADLTDFAIRRMIERFGADGTLRETLSRRDDVGPEMRHAIVVATAKVLGDFARHRGWMGPERIGRMIAESCDRATVHIASSALGAKTEHRRFVSYLRENGALTPALILRGLLSGNVGLFEAVLGELSGQSDKRVGALVRNPDGLGFAGLYKATGLPAGLLTAFRAALAVATGGEARRSGHDLRLDQRIVERVIEACGTQNSEDVERLTALLRRFEAEAARDAARAGIRRYGAAEGAAPAIQDRARRPLAEIPAVRAAA